MSSEVQEISEKLLKNLIATNMKPAPEVTEDNQFHSEKVRMLLEMALPELVRHVPPDELLGVVMYSSLTGGVPDSNGKPNYKSDVDLALITTGTGAEALRQALQQTPTGWANAMDLPPPEGRETPLQPFDQEHGACYKYQGDEREVELFVWTPEVLAKALAGELQLDTSNLTDEEKAEMQLDSKKKPLSPQKSAYLIATGNIIYKGNYQSPIHPDPFEPLRETAQTHFSDPQSFFFKEDQWLPTLTKVINQSEPAVTAA